MWNPTSRGYYFSSNVSNYCFILNDSCFCYVSSVYSAYNFYIHAGELIENRKDYSTLLIQKEKGNKPEINRKIKIKVYPKYKDELVNLVTKAKLINSEKSIIQGVVLV